MPADTYHYVVATANLTAVPCFSFIPVLSLSKIKGKSSRSWPNMRVKMVAHFYVDSLCFGRAEGTRGFLHVKQVYY